MILCFWGFSSFLLNGKTGTGKEIAAQLIHNLSDRYGNPFISINCGAIPPNLLESTLYGTVKGSFTGAADTPGLFEQADGGTLFLDEINSIDIYLPSLAERKEDIEPLVDYFLHFFNENMNMSIEGVEQEGLECFKRYSWPGNIRELKNAIETAYNSTDSNRIAMGDLPKRISQSTDHSIHHSDDLKEGFIKRHN